MKYIWEAFLEDKDRDIFLSQADVISPYYEIPPKQDRWDNHIEYNAMIRYGAIFGPLLDLDQSQSTGLDKVLFDVISHFLIQLDLKKGYSYREYGVRMLDQNMMQGMYGDSIKKQYGKLSIKKRYQVMHYLELAQHTGASMILFSKVVISLLETGVIYRDRTKQESYLLYLGKKQNEADLNLIQLLQDLFLPFGYSLRVMWDKHFGVWGNDNTLRYNRIELI